MSKRQVVKYQWGKLKQQHQLSVISQIVVLVGVAFALLWPTPLIRNQLFAVWSDSDLVFSQWPFALLIQRTLAQTHQLPFWNPYFGGGQPVSGDPLAALFYPPTLLVHFFSLRDYFLVLILGHLVFTGLGMLLLARSVLKLPYFPALVAAVSYMATPRLISHLGAGHITIVQTVAWYPWLALTCWATVLKPHRWGALLGMCIGLMMLAGHPQMAYYGLLLVVGLAVWLLIKRRRSEGRFWSLIGLAVAGVIGVLLAAVHLLPLLEFTAHSTRQSSLSSGDAFPLLDFLHALFFLPSPLGSPWEAIISPGLTVLIPALLAIVACWRKVWPFVFGLILLALLAMGNASLFYIIVSRLLPGLDLFRGLNRIWFVALFLIALLAGIGTDWLLCCTKRIPFHKKLSIHFRTVSTGIVGFLVVLVVASSLIVTDIGYSRTGDVRTITTPSNLMLTAAHLAGSGRIYDVQENISQINAVQLQSRLADGWDPLLIENYVSYMQRAGGYTHTGYTLHIPYDSPSVQPNAALLGWMNVSTVVSRRPLTDARFVQEGAVDGILIYKNTVDAGPAYLVKSGIKNNPPGLNEMKRLGVQISTITFAPERETFAFSSNTSAFFVIATPMFPGWTANLDNHSVPIQQIADVMPAIKVGPGTHTLSYTYTPSYIRLGAILSVISFFAALTWLLSGYYFHLSKTRRFWFSIAKNLNGKKRFKLNLSERSSKNSKQRLQYRKRGSLP